MISIVIPLYNKAQSITRTLDSVISQTFTDYEIIVVNDGSTDGSGDVVEQYAANHPQTRFHLIHKENGGVSSARNAGIWAAFSEYIALLDGDDYWDKSFLEEQLKLIEDFPEASMWGVNYAFVKGKNCTPCHQGLDDGFRGYVDNYFGTSHNDLFCSSSVVVRKDAFENIGYYDERISSSEDLDVWYRIILKYPIVYYDKVLAYYNQNAENRVAYDTKVRFPLHRDIKYYIDKYRDDFTDKLVFARYLCDKFAASLLKDGYYFGTESERRESDHVVKHLQYSLIHPKYRFIFQTPRWLGWIVYKIVCLKKRLY